MAINPADSQKCANELAGKDPFAVVSTLNFFGNHFPIYEQAGIQTSWSARPITIGDFTAPGRVLHRSRRWLPRRPHRRSSSPPPRSSRASGSRCRGPTRRPGSSATTTSRRSRSTCCRAPCPATPSWPGRIPDLEHIGVPIKPATPDVTPQVTQVLDFDPDVILFSAQGADCWNLVDGLGRAGWTPEQIPLIMTGGLHRLREDEGAPATSPRASTSSARRAPASPSPESITDPRHQARGRDLRREGRRVRHARGRHHQGLRRCAAGSR